MSIFRSILDRLIYNDECEVLDSNLTDCNVGARKERNIRDNIFVINAITNAVKKKKNEAMEFQVYDVEKCFDKLWLQKVINCLYNAGLQNDKLPLLILTNTRLGLQCQTPLRSYPLTLIPYPISLIPTPCPLSPSTVPSRKI